MVSREWMDKDFYAVLGVASDASSSDIKSAYRKLARELHPDHNPDNPKAEDRFKEVSEAFAVLSDDAQRKEYDEMRSLMGAGAFRRVLPGPAVRYFNRGRAPCGHRTLSAIPV